jgi:hypothetical protein
MFIMPQKPQWRACASTLQAIHSGSDAVGLTTIRSQPIQFPYDRDRATLSEQASGFIAVTTRIQLRSRCGAVETSIAGAMSAGSA